MAENDDIPTIEWRSTGDVKYTHAVVYRENPPRWWQFWRKGWWHTLRHGPVIGYYKLD